ncbi:MAG: ribosome maturation factor RimP [Leptolyngbyaceae bacterium]|nr:ribosome maturation factor RimP [Leptolyngbyaceae bacterium]
MTHPLVPQIIDLATPIANQLGLEIVNVVFQTNHSPPVLRVDIRNLHSDTGLTDCESMSHQLETTLDSSELIPDAYVLEISSPGVSQLLTSDRDFISFKGFPVTVETTEPYKGNLCWQGQLTRRDSQAVVLSIKGRIVSIPNDLIKAVQLAEPL